MPFCLQRAIFLKEMKKKHRQWLDQFLGNCAALNRSEHTLVNYRSDLQKFIEFYEYNYRGKLYRAKASCIEEYQKFLAGKRLDLPNKRRILWWRRQVGAPVVGRALSINTQKRHLSTIKNFYDYLIEANQDKMFRFFKLNPVRPKIHTIKLKDQDINHTKLLNHRDWDGLMRTLKRPKEFLVAYLLYYGGLRLEELCRLTYQDFSPRTKSLSFIRKGGKRHFLKLHEFDTIYDYLERHRQLGRHDSDKLFVNAWGRQVSKRAMHGYIKRMLKRAGLSQELTPHSFRKACATNLYMQFKDILLVRNYLNHQDAKVTQTYIEY